MLLCLSNQLCSSSGAASSLCTRHAQCQACVMHTAAACDCKLMQQVWRLLNAPLEALQVSHAQKAHQLGFMELSQLHFASLEIFRNLANLMRSWQCVCVGCISMLGSRNNCSNNILLHEISPSRLDVSSAGTIAQRQNMSRASFR